MNTGMLSGGIPLRPAVASDRPGPGLRSWWMLPPAGLIAPIRFTIGTFGSAGYFCERLRVSAEVFNAGRNELARQRPDGRVLQNLPLEVSAAASHAAVI